MFSQFAVFTYLHTNAQERRDKVAMTGAIHILNTKSAKTLSTTLGDAKHGEDAGGGWSGDMKTKKGNYFSHPKFSYGLRLRT